MMLDSIARLLRRSATFLEILASRGAVRTRVVQDQLTYLDAHALRLLERQARDVESRGVEGCFLETGCALGGSSIVIASSKSPTRDFYVYDTFGMIPPPTEKDGADVHARYREIVAGQSEGIGGSTYYGYRKDLLDQVRASFVRYGLPPGENRVHFVQGLYGDTLEPPGAVAFAHIDCDWYDSVMVCLERVAPAFRRAV